ncbi:MAG: hypothetical protein SGARI_007697, partial [Bacillariaceae sp.]
MGCITKETVSGGIRGCPLICKCQTRWILSVTLDLPAILLSKLFMYAVTVLNFIDNSFLEKV